MSKPLKKKSREARITYYDLDRIDRTSFYLTGFLRNQKKYGYKFVVKRSAPSFLQAPSVAGEWLKFLFAVGLFACRLGGEEFYFCIDRSDHSTNKMNEGFLLPLLRKVKYYFKVNYNREAIDADPSLLEFRNKIIPIAPSFPIRMPSVLPFLPRVIPSREMSWTVKKAKERLRHLTQIPSLEDYRRWRQIKPDIDVFFVLYHYWQPHHSELSEFRYRIMRELNKRRDINAVIGFVSDGKLPEKYASLRHEPYGTRDYLLRLARSKVAIYVRGPHDGISSKFGQLLALGKPIIGQSIRNNKELLYGNEHFDKQFIYDDPREIVEQVDGLLQQPGNLALLADSNARTFDTQLAPEISIAGIIELVLDCGKRVQ